jgi:hypothetical protein
MIAGVLIFTFWTAAHRHSGCVGGAVAERAVHVVAQVAFKIRV